MANGKPAGAQDKAQAPHVEDPLDPTVGAGAAAMTDAEVLELRQKLEAAEALAERAAEAAAEAQQRADAEASRAEAALEGRSELEQTISELQRLERAPAEPALGDKLADVLERLGEQLGARGVEEATFRAGESAESVIKAIEGKVSRGEHSGRVAPGGMVTFLSRGSNLVVLKKGRIRYADARGQLAVTEGVQYDFAPDGRFETDDEEVIEYLEARPAFGVEFWEMGHDPHKAPTPAPVLDEIMDAVINLDDDRLAEIEQEEQEGLKREIVLSQVASARRKVQGLGEGLGVTA